MNAIITQTARAKLNYALDVLASREDGYHDLCMVMGSVELGDTVTVSLRTDGAILAESNFPWVPKDERNLGVKAAKAFFAALGDTKTGAEIHLHKIVPVGAGMAGGSADAAAVLRALNTLTGAGLGSEELRRIGLAVGSDVPYCITGGMALAEGRGEQLTPLPDLPPCWIVIAKPGFSISTGELFRQIDSRIIRTRPDTAGMLSAIRQGDLGGVARRMYNVFEDALPRRSREIFSIRGELLSHGALGAVMTGTGSAVFGVFDEENAAKKAREALSGQYRACFLTRPAPAETI
ncbi:MAG: 4-(cytidine 5'-diphospho)-2-C-methyl-D-erythritol kinase [Oscillospiraceae bacterium]|nr:4-(cytidine 5'-diphospho)-2-C-methyl-D-erythritol kinase [Oscillospiraceae bacterium]